MHCISRRNEFFPKTPKPQNPKTPFCEHCNYLNEWIEETSLECTGIGTIHSFITGLASATGYPGRTRNQVLQRGETARVTPFTCHPAQLSHYLGIFGSLRSWLLQLINKWNSNSKGRYIKSSKLDDPRFPFQFDLSGAFEFIPVHLAVPARAWTGGK